MHGRGTSTAVGAKSGAADSDCGVKLGAENSLSGLKHCVRLLLMLYIRGDLKEENECVIINRGKRVLYDILLNIDLNNEHI